ncbi:MAG: cell division protein FtsL [Bacillota bacterium]
MHQARKIAPINRIPSPAQPTRAPGISNQPEKRLKKLKLLSVIAACFILSLVVIAQYSSLVVLNYHLSSARSELASVQESVRVREIEVARLSSINRIENIAKEELGMVEPEVDQLNIISANRGVERESRRPGE